MISLRCIGCEKKFERSEAYVRRGKLKYKINGFCCSRQCSSRIGRRTQ